MERQDSSGLSGSSQFQRLAPEALARVLGAVPQQHRLAVCALVCPAWRNAALAATTQLELKLCSDEPQRAAQVSAWLARHGDGLHSLLVARDDSSPAHTSLQPPWPSLRQLRRLSLKTLEISCGTSTAGTATATGPGGRQQLAQLTSLTSLALDGCTISSGVLDLCQQQLPALRLLQELQWKGWGEDWLTDELVAALAAALRQLTALTRLHVVITPDGAAAVISSLSSLPRLLDLGLQGTMRQGGNNASLSISWSDVPASVTALRLSGSIVLQLRAASGAGRPIAGCPLTALQQLSITFKDGLGFPGVAALSSLPQLRQLDITASFATDPVAGTRALLAFVAQQQQLQSLSLEGDIKLPAEQTQHYAAALAASSQLTALIITVGHETPASAVVSAVFGAGRRLPPLQRLWLWTEDLCDEQDLPWGLAPQDVSRLLQACPGLQELELVPARSDAATAAAAGITWSDVAGTAAAQLTKLRVASDDVNAAFAVQFLAQLTGLQALHLAMSEHITWAELAPLTRLTRLTRLEAFSCGPYDEELEGRLEFDLTNQAWPGQPPDVVQQLRARCWSVAPAACVLSEQVELLQEQLAQQQGRIADLEARLAAAEAAAGFVDVTRP